jgi:thiol-disulfide isomerase/thioredoxin
MNRKLIVGISITIVVILTLFYSYFSGKSQKDDIYSQLQILPHFDRKAVEGQYFVLHFWAKWCAPCAEEIPHLIKFAGLADQKLKGLKILAVSLDETLEQAKTILPNQGVNLPANFLLFLDPQHTVAEGLGSYQYPETYFYGPKGQVLEKWVGPQKWDADSVMEYFSHKILPNP